MFGVEMVVYCVEDINGVHTYKKYGDMMLGAIIIQTIIILWGCYFKLKYGFNEIQTKIWFTVLFS